MRKIAMTIHHRCTQVGRGGKVEKFGHTNAKKHEKEASPLDFLTTLSTPSKEFG